MKAPNTDKTLGITKDWGDEKFRAVRHRAKYEEEDRHKKARRNKKEKSSELEFKIDDLVVVSQGYSNRHYFLLQVIDYNPIEEIFFGVLRNTTDPKYFEKMIGHLIMFYGYRHWSGFEVQRVPPDSVKWKVK